MEVGGNNMYKLITDGIDILQKVGGFEIGSMAGVILGCSANRVPVVLDGFISYAAALIAVNINPRCKDYDSITLFSRTRS